MSIIFSLIQIISKLINVRWFQIKLENLTSNYLIPQNVNTGNFSRGGHQDFIGSRGKMSGDINLGHHSEDILDSRAFNFEAKSNSSTQSLKV